MKQKITRRYKPGQFVSICRKLARVCKHTSLSMNACDECAIANKWERKNYCFLNSSECIEKLGLNLYPKLIKQCEKQEKQ